MNNRVTSLGTDPTLKVLIRLALPSMASLLINASYNIIDSLFVGRVVGTVGLAAVGLNFPYYIFLISLGVLVGVGGAARISRSLGEHQYPRAQRGLGSSIALLLILSIGTTLVFASMPGFWVRVLGARGEAYEGARSYFSIIALGSTFVLFNQSLNNLVYAEGNGSIGFASLAFSSITNIILDWLFIVVLGWGIEGAAWATFIAQGLGTMLLVAYFFLPVSQLKMNLNWDRESIRYILRIGFSAALRTFSVVFFGITINFQAFRAEGDMGIAVASVIFRVISFVILPAFGINQAFLPIAAYNYGAKQYDRMLSASKQAIVLGLGVCYTAALLVGIFSSRLALAFNPDPVFVDLAGQGFRIAFLATPLIIFNLVASGMYQAIGAARQSILIALSRMVFFLLPLMLILPTFLGIRGIWIAFPTGETLTALFAILMGYPVVAMLRQEAEL